MNTRAGAKGPVSWRAARPFQSFHFGGSEQVDWISCLGTFMGETEIVVVYEAKDATRKMCWPEFKLILKFVYSSDGMDCML